MTLVSLETLPRIAEDIVRVAYQQRSGAGIIALSGELGAGKTTLTKAIAETLGVVESIVSPTFVIMKRYVTKDERFTTLIHVDAYRLDTEEEALRLGFLEWCADPSALLVVEWPERLSTLIPTNAVHVDVTVASPTERTIVVR